MTTTKVIYDPRHDGALFVAAVFDPNGCLIASRAFKTREGAEAFLQAFMQESAGEHGLTLD
jgi:hypothetical protein